MLTSPIRIFCYPLLFNSKIYWKWNRTRTFNILIILLLMNSICFWMISILEELLKRQSIRLLRNRRYSSHFVELVCLRTLINRISLNSWNRNAMSNWMFTKVNNFTNSPRNYNMTWSMLMNFSRKIPIWLIKIFWTFSWRITKIWKSLYFVKVNNVAIVCMNTCWKKEYKVFCIILD